MLALYMKFSNLFKHVKVVAEVVAEIIVIPRNMSFAVLRSSFLIHITFSDDVYSRKFYSYSLYIMH